MSLKSLLQEKNMTMYSLSKKTGIPQTTIRDICNNKVLLKNCSAEKVRRISNALSMSMEELLDYNKENITEDLDELYNKRISEEEDNKDILINFDKKYDGVLTQDNVHDILQSLKERR